MEVHYIEVPLYHAPLDTNNEMIFKRTLHSHAVMGTTPSHARATSV